MKEKGRLLFFILPSVAIALFILLVFVGALSYEGVIDWIITRLVTLFQIII